MTLNLKADVATDGQVTFYLPSSFRGRQVDLTIEASTSISSGLSNEDLIAERQKQIAAVQRSYGVFADTDFETPEDPPGDQEVDFE